MDEENTASEEMMEIPVEEDVSHNSSEDSNHDQESESPNIIEPEDDQEEEACSEEIFKTLSSEDKDTEKENFSMIFPNSGEENPGTSSNVAIDEEEEIEIEEEQENENVEVDDEEDDDDFGVHHLPLFKVKKIMKIMPTVPDEEGQEPLGNVLFTKEAIYLTAAATELFVSALSQSIGRVTATNKKKTMTMQHLKTVFSQSDSFDFLEGCFPEIF